MRLYVDAANGLAGPWMDAYAQTVEEEGAEDWQRREGEQNVRNSFFFFFFFTDERPSPRHWTTNRREGEEEAVEVEERPTTSIPSA